MEPMEKQNLSERITERLIAAIRSGELSAGQKLPSETELAASLCVSRNILREAIKTLEMFGVIESIHGRGTFLSGDAAARIANLGFVAALAQNRSVQSLLDSRLVLEPGLAEMAALRRTEDDLRSLRGAIGVMVRPDSCGGPSFHEAVARAAHCELPEKLMGTVLAQLSATDYARVQAEMTEKTLRLEIGEHTRILESIEAGDGETARRRMEAHLRSRFSVIGGFSEEKRR